MDRDEEINDLMVERQKHIEVEHGLLIDTKWKEFYHMLVAGQEYALAGLLSYAVTLVKLQRPDLVQRLGFHAETLFKVAQADMLIAQKIAESAAGAQSEQNTDDDLSGVIEEETIN